MRAQAALRTPGLATQAPHVPTPSILVQCPWAAMSPVGRGRVKARNPGRARAGVQKARAVGCGFFLSDFKGCCSLVTGQVPSRTKPMEPRGQSHCGVPTRAVLCGATPVTPAVETPAVQPGELWARDSKPYSCARWSPASLRWGIPEPWRPSACPCVSRRQDSWSEIILKPWDLVLFALLGFGLAWNPLFFSSFQFLPLEWKCLFCACLTIAFRVH